MFGSYVLAQDAQPPPTKTPAAKVETKVPAKTPTKRVRRVRRAPTKAPAKASPPPTKAPEPEPAPKVASEPEKPTEAKGEATEDKGLKDVPEAVEEVKSIWADFKGGKYREAMAGVVVVLLFLWRRFASRLIVGKLSKWWLAFVTMLLGYLGTIPEALTMDPFSWGKFVWTGLITGSEAMAIWFLIGKKILPNLFDEEKWQKAKNGGKPAPKKLDAEENS
jgi:hypothetical protein